MGLSIVLTSLLVSFNHIKREMSWDRYNAYAGRIVRLTLAVDGQPIDGRLWGNVLDEQCGSCRKWKKSPSCMKFTDLN